MKKDFLRQIIALGDRTQHGRHFLKGGKTQYAKVEGAITDAMLDAHLDGSQPLGMYLNVDDDKSHFLVFDFDDHAGDGIAFGPTMAVVGQLNAENIPHVLVRSGGGHGFHVWLCFENAKRVDLMKEAAKNILSRVEVDKETFVAVSSGSLNRTKYNAKGKATHVEHGVEVLPKGKGLQLVALPFSRASVPVEIVSVGGVSEIVETATVPQIEFVKNKKPGPKASPESAAVDRDAAFNAFVCEYDADDRAQWGAAAICLQAAFGAGDEWARERWTEWSRTSPKYEAGDEADWDRMSGAAKYTAWSFWRLAEKHGYKGKSPFTATEKRKLLALDFLSDVRIIRDKSNVAYAELKDRHWVRIDTDDFKYACALGMMRAYQKMPQEQDMKSAQMIALAQAAEAAPEPVDLRFAKVGGKRYVFLADPERTIIEIDADGWRVNNDAPVQFRSGVSLPMGMPENGTLDELIGFLNVDDDSMVFLLAWMVTAIVNPAEQCPIAILDGSAGSAKSSTLTTIVEIIDPKVAAQAGEPKSADDLVVAAYQSAIMSFDNVDTLARLSDDLCRLSTGGGLSKRKLYSDGDVFAVDAMRPVLAAGLDPTFYKQDLIERIIRMSLTRPKEYMDEEVFRATRTEKMPRFRGALLTLVSDVLKKLHLVTQVDSRFGVYSRVGECVAQAMGRDDGWFGERYRQMRMELALEAASSDSVYIFLTEFLRGFSQKVGTEQTYSATELFLEMKTTLSDFIDLISIKDVPGNARAISPRIVQASTLIEKSEGWRVSRSRNRQFVFTKVRDTEMRAEDVVKKLREHRDTICDEAGI